MAEDILIASASLGLQLRRRRIDSSHTNPHPLQQYVIWPPQPSCVCSRNSSRVQNRRVQRFFATFFKMVRHFPKITTFFKMTRHFSENLVTTCFKMTVKHVLFENYGRAIFGLSSMYRRYHVHFQLIFEPLYFEPLKCSIKYFQVPR